eukprot:scaffold4057_cov129-Isochrysis_galbana.AAC.2
MSGSERPSAKNGRVGSARMLLQSSGTGLCALLRVAQACVLSTNVFVVRKRKIVLCAPGCVGIVVVVVVKLSGRREPPAISHQRKKCPPRHPRTPRRTSTSRGPPTRYLRMHLPTCAESC